MTSVRRFAVPAVAALALSIGVAPAAHAKGGDGVEKRGACSASSDWKLKAKHDNGRIEVEFEVDSNRIGQTWNVRLSDNGQQFFAGTRRTVGPSGSFEVRRLTANRTGTDHIVGFARNARSGETCRGALAI